MAALKAWIIGVFCAVLFTDSFTTAIVFPRDDIASVLGPQLSSGAQIVLSSNPDFGNATARWSLFDHPKFTAAVKVRTEEDVAATVRYANQNSIPFLAVVGTHGTIASLGKFNGIEILMHGLNSTVISKDGKTATFGGGKKSFQVIDDLWAAGKQTVSGICECTGYLGPALGGGHGVLQGKYGLIADQFISMRMVTADGVLRDVSASGPNSDLWWGMRGAGHNFGIVTSFTSKIYDVPYGGLWSHETFIFNRSKVEAVFDTINWLSTQQPPGMFNRDLIYRDPTKDPNNPVLEVDILEEGVSAVNSTFTDRFRALGPMSVTSSSGTYKDIPRWAGVGRHTAACKKKDFTKIRFPIGLISYNATALGALFDEFTKVTVPGSPFNRSEIMFEGYSQHGVREIPTDSTAFPDRADNQLVTIGTANSHDPGLDAQALKIGDSLRQILLDGSGSPDMHSYVNYAAGTESLQSMYGFEPWRLKKLKELKAKYDPHERFGYYAPIPV
ncbi:putative FAD-dependent oxygenase [Aspergillus ellipticus CBS 707.79]|uniref:Putative FAD-dependent oxygenase n=1 Tax=Aspergillus ellipticus CBS 707.79 TaxID=1448320 RepID=A0A319CZV6_9EURO|nr:putative FAD-dependent oxygenase [Aspergillus ellipticus CBS 707.79]